jgi:uncharacterized ferredoxin-like protein
MSQSTPVCSLFCSKCKRESAKSFRHYDRGHVRDYLDIEVVGVTAAGAAKCRCRKCGYEYKSTSAAARREARHFLKTE